MHIDKSLRVYRERGVYARSTVKIGDFANSLCNVLRPGIVSEMIRAIIILIMY